MCNKMIKVFYTYNFSFIFRITKRYCTFTRVKISSKCNISESYLIESEKQNTENDIIVSIPEVDQNTKDRFIQIMEDERIMKYTNKKIPTKLSIENINELLCLDTISSKCKYLNYLFKKEKSQENRLLKQQARLEEREIIKSEKVKSSNHIEYGTGKNTILLPIRRPNITKLADLRVAYANLFGQTIVVDIDYDQYMTRKECRNCASQLSLLWGANRASLLPFNVYFCNAKFSNPSLQFLEKLMPTLSKPDCLINISESSYLEHFEKERLVYLSPHATEPLIEYDHNAIYIIGAFVDTSKRCHVSHEKAEKEGIKAYSLPLNKHIVWSCGSRSLTVNQVFEIMLKMKISGDWKSAFSVVPQRKIKKIDVDLAEVNNSVSD